MRGHAESPPGSSLVAACALPQLLKEAVESQRMCELMKQQETHLKQQVSYLGCVLSLVVFLGVRRKSFSTLPVPDAGRVALRCRCLPYSPVTR